MFHALVAGEVAVEGVEFEVVMADIEELNDRAGSEDALEVTKLSVSAFGRLRERYAALQAGAALGRGCGPLVVRDRSRSDLATLEALKGRRVAVPGLGTTAFDLLQRFGPRLEPVPMRFDEIMPALADGRFDAGVIIHEGRFTYERHGLALIADLGEFWEASTGDPLPLGIIAMSRAHAEHGPAVEEALGASVAAARADPSASADYVRAHAREMDEDVCARHIDLYVNAYSVALGSQGRRAVEALVGPGPSPWL